MPKKITPCLWYDGKAEEAANFYVTLFPNSRIDNVVRSPAANPSGPEGMVLVVEFTLDGEPYIGLNGGPKFPFTEAVSFQVRTADQSETDRLWDALIADGGEESMCGWLKDRWGLSWQITPQRLLDLMADPDHAKSKRAMEAMLQMRKIDIAAVEKAAQGNLVQSDPERV
jgi:predicted 3-demethylubiquinone-9 3-methyltransferase (glyoxalase superfamily)